MTRFLARCIPILLICSYVLSPSGADAIEKAYSARAVPIPAGVSVHRPGQPIAMAGLSWDGVSTDEASIRWFRDGAWSGWATLDLQSEDGPDGSSDVVRTEPIWLQDATAVQVRTPAGGRGPRLTLVTEDGTVAIPRAVAHAAGSQPPMGMRTEWGARPPKATPEYASGLKMGFVHHTAGSNDYTVDQVPSILRALQAYHMDGNGWNDLGYNFLVDRFGRIWEGRDGGVDRAVIGAHSQGFNTGSTGVAVIGEFGAVDPSASSVDAVSRLLAWKLTLHGVDPAGRTTMISGGSNKYQPGTAVDLPTIAGHRDAQATSCPGDRLYVRLDQIRRDAAILGAAILAYPGFRGGVFTATGNLDADGVDELVTGADGGGGPHVRTFDADGRPLTSFFPYDIGFRGGVRVATYSIGVGVDRIVTAAGPGGGPHVKTFNVSGTATSNGFFAYDIGFSGGVFVGAGNIDGLPGDEIVTGAGSGGGPHVRVFRPDGSLLTGFFPYDIGFRGGVRVATANLDGLPGDEIVTSPGPGGGPHIRIWRYKGGAIEEVRSFWAYDWRFLGGVYVSGVKFPDGTGGVVTGAGETGGPHVRVFDASGSIESEFFYLRSDLVRGVRPVGGYFVDEDTLSIAVSGGPQSYPLVGLRDPTGTVVSVSP